MKLYEKHERFSFITRWTGRYKKHSVTISEMRDDCGRYGGELMINSGMMSSKTDMWETPQDFYNKLDLEFGFELDVCALRANAKAPRFFTPEQDGLKQRWNGICWMNPPYGRKIGNWIEKAYQSALDGATVVCLLPSRTDTRWFHEYCLKSSDIRFIKGRIHFGGSKNSAPFPSFVVVFSPKTIKGE